MRSREPRRSSCGRMASVGCSCQEASSTARCRRTTSRPSRRSTIRSTSSRRVRSISTGRIAGNALAKVGDPKFPYVITTYRLTEHYLAGAMSRWLPWLTELQPELFVEISPELAQEKGIKNLDWCKISSPRGAIRAKALVTRRMRPFTIDGKVVHQVGMPWHWGYEGLSTGDVVNELTVPHRRSERFHARGKSVRVQRGESVKKMSQFECSKFDIPTDWA